MVAVDLWKQLYDRYKGDAGALTMMTIPILMASEVPIYLFTLLDALQLKSLYPYRLHYDQNFSGHLNARVYPPWQVVKDVAKVAEFNFVFAYLIPGTLAIWIANKLKIFVYDTERELTWKRLIKETVMISIVADIMFYWIHRLVHLPQFYIDWHKKHHELKYSFAMVHHYMTYHEALLFAIPQALPPMLLWAALGHKMHVASMWGAFLFTQMAAILGHAGWQVPWPESLPFLKPNYHDAHHVDYKHNFGAMFEFTDALFGTLIKAKVAHPTEIAERALGKAHDYVQAAATVKAWPRFP